MKDFIRNYWKTLLFFMAVGLVGGFFLGFDILDTYPKELQQQLLEQLDGPVSVNLVLGLATAVQSVGYGLFCGVLGILLGKQVGLWKDERAITKKPLLIALAVAVIGGLGMLLPDLLFFGNYSQAIRDSYAVKPTVTYWLACVAYGGVLEEVMLRLFMMSLMAFILQKLLPKSETACLIVANVLAAVLFAAGHLPTTIVTLGASPLILIRCFVLNGGFGLVFGWLYRKYGLRYAMIAHGGCHVVSKLIWILFL